MRYVLRPLVAIGIVGFATAAGAYQLQPEPGAPPGEVDASVGDALAPYQLARLKVLEATLYHVDESYAEPARIDWEAMFVGALGALERRVPAVLVDRSVEGERLALDIDRHATVLEVPAIGSSRELQRHLQQVAQLVELHLDPASLPDALEADGFAGIEYVLVNGLLDTLDPHTVLLPPEDADEMDVENRGEFGGLGITIVDREGALTIERTLPGTPAERAGLVKDDRLTRIAGHSTINMSLDEAVALLRGGVGEPITIEISRDALSDPLEIQIVRELIKLNEVQGELLEGDIGVVRIPSFHRQVERDLHDLLARLKRESAQGRLNGVVLDLRDNPGGYLSQGIAVADTFLADGEIVSTLDRSGQRRDVKRARDTARTEGPYPMVVLLNAASASASEIVAGALRNNERAVIIGERSFGKGSVQDLHEFHDRSKLKLTISQYLTPGERSIQAVGIPADIELVPVRLEDGDDGLTARVYWRERVRREADLGHRLDRVGPGTSASDQAAYRLVHVDGSRRGASRPLDTTDYATAFAREVLLASSGGRRADVLVDAAAVVDVHARRGDRELRTALEAHGIDWRDGRRPATLPDRPVVARLDLGPTGAIPAGQRHKVTLTLTNTSDAPLYRVGALVAEHDVLAGREFLFGHLPPGESRSFDVWVNLLDGYPTRTEEMVLSVRDGEDEPLTELRLPVPIVGRPLPSLAWDITLTEIDGDGDGVAEVGERVGLQVRTINRGDGPSGAAFVRLKNRSGPGLDIVEGSLEPGTLARIDGTACDEADRRSGCQLRLAPGQSDEGLLVVQLKQPSDDGWQVELLLGDDEAYDHASVVGAGFYEYFQQKVAVRIPADRPLTTRTLQPPDIQLSRAPTTGRPGRRVTVSGRVEDDRGVRRVMVFAGDDKVAHLPEQDDGVRSAPFTADVSLAEGVNWVTVVAQDTDGLVYTRSVAVEGVAAEVVSQRSDVP